MIRVGIGYDLHRLVRGRPFILAGIRLQAKRGELAYSDGDVLAHAVCDALLGASALGDIGSLFPPSDERWKDADSMRMLASVYDLVRERGWNLVNLDCIVNCEEPRILDYRDEIRANLARVLRTEADRIFVKGKTGEGVGKVGKGRAVQVWATCLLDNPEKEA
ncbi:MAG: 2-C-methyl-D-erythritol 2,4-cyclodiphosphate synthase [Treponema sp.]|nr:2-C-methyl-D-erythritol 2,4-cyclodiphosphate synthase [Treponema sp.]